MDKTTVDFTKTLGKVKPMHSVNNGPVYKFASYIKMANFNTYLLKIVSL